MLSKERLSRSFISNKILTSVRHDIVSGKLLPNTVLTEPMLAERFNYSRGPVRTALMVLESEGLIRVLPSGRTLVVGLTPKLIDDLFRFRLNLETLATDLMTKTPPLNLDGLRTIVRKMQHSRDPAMLRELNVQFHSQLVQLSDNDFLHKAWLQLAPIFEAILAVTDPQLPEDVRIAGTHQELVQIISEHRWSALSTALAEHMERPRRLITEHVDRLLAKQTSVPDDSATHRDSETSSV